VLADVSKLSEARTAIDSFDKVDILVNNAGTAAPAMCDAMTEDQWDGVLNVNLKGTFNCISAVVHHMISRRSGKIVNISSVAGRNGMIGNANYSTSKAGIDGLTERRKGTCTLRNKR